MSVSTSIQKAIAANLANIPEYAMARRKEETAARQAEENVKLTTQNIQASKDASEIARRKALAEEKKAEADAKNPWSPIGNITDAGTILFYNKDNGQIEYRKPELVKTPAEWASTT